MNVTRISVDGVEPVTLDEAKQQCYIPTTDTDSTMEDLLNSFITAARKYGENRTWRTLIDSTWEYRMDEFPYGITEHHDDGKLNRNIIELPKPPLIEVDSIKYISNGSEQTLDASDYTVDNSSTPGRIEPDSFWPNTDDIIDAVRIRYTAGYEDSNSASSVPEDIKIALRMLVKFMYDNRDSYVLTERSASEILEMPIGTNSILDNNAVRRFV